MTDELAYCNPKVTCVVEADLETVWRVVKQWSTFYWLETVQGQPCIIQKYEGDENAIGSSRTVEIGESLMFERLVAMDDEDHIMKWRTMAHADSVTPFEHASYINSILSMTLRQITHDDHTFVEWQAAFYTEQEFANEMHTALEVWITGALGTLQRHVTRENPTVDMRRRASEIPPPPRSVQSFAPDDHVARFADLHVSSGPVPGPSAGQDPRYASRGMPPPPILDPRMQQASRPMGSSSRLAPMGGPPQAPMGARPQDPMQAWQSVQHPAAGRSHHRAAREMNPDSARAIQDWATKQQQAQHRQRHRSHAMGSTYAPSHVSDCSNSIDGMEAPMPRASHSSRYQPSVMGHSRANVKYSPRQSLEIDERYNPAQQDPAQQWEIPGMAQQHMAPNAYYNQPNLYDARASRQSGRSRPSGQGSSPHRGLR